MTNDTIVQKIWSLCNILRGDGISYHQYVSELTYLLFLKIAEESDTEHLLPEGCRWSDLTAHTTSDLLGFYQEMLTHLGNAAEVETIRAIFAFPTTVFSHGENLRAVIDGISGIEWRDVSEDRFGLIYEGLIEKSAQDVRSGAGQYFTPRSLVDSMVRLTEPQLGEVIQDPATGSGGFLIASDQYIRSAATRDAYLNSPPRYEGAEIEKNTRRICLMNTFLHGMQANVIYGDALTDDVNALEKADLILANPPFGNKAGSRRTLRADIPHPRANKQLAFLQHIYLGLKEGGRAAVVLPDNVLTEPGIGRAIRGDLLDQCNVHTLLRLPSGIFSGANVKTNVLFFGKNHGGTEQLWVYDLRTNVPPFGKTTPLKAEHFADFEIMYGEDRNGLSRRQDQGKSGRFRCFTRDQIKAREDNLDITWLRDNSAALEETEEVAEDIAAEILSHLRSAIAEMEGLTDELAQTDDGTEAQSDVP